MKKYKGRRLTDNSWVEGSYCKNADKHYIFPADGADSYDQYEVAADTISEVTIPYYYCPHCGHKWSAYSEKNGCWACNFVRDVGRVKA